MTEETSRQIIDELRRIKNIAHWTGEAFLEYLVTMALEEAILKSGRLAYAREKD